MISEYTRVSLTSDRYEKEGARQGMLGYVIEVYDGGYYEVEFSDPETGCTVAQVVVAQDDIEERPESDG